MRRLRRSVRLLGRVVSVVLLTLAGLAWMTVPAAAKGKKPAAASASAGKKTNACGCYADSQGNCFCGRKGKCACPGECEPKGCEEKRAKQMDKEIAAETKKAADADKKQRRGEGASHAADKPSTKPSTKGKPPAAKPRDPSGQ